MRIGGFDESIVSPLAVASRRHESRATQVREVPRNLWLIRLQHFDAGTDTEFIIAEQLDEAQSSAVREGFEKCFQVGTHLPSITNSDAKQFPVDRRHFSRVLYIAK